MSFEYTLTSDPLAGRRLPTNRRASVRYQCGPATPGRVLVDGQEWQRAWVLDLSLGGVGLLLNRPLETHSELIIVLKNDALKKVFELPARVCHAVRQMDGDWIVGCEFADKLTEEQLDELL
jgi:hypothetical protein